MYERNPVPQLNFSLLPHPSPLIMPPHSISFWVLPDAKAAACMPPTRQRRSILDVDPDTTHLAVVFPVEDILSAEDDAECPKGKRCHLNKKRSNGTENGDECPDGCHPANHLGGCGLRGLKIMAPGCSTQQVLERLIYITNQRKSGCCCDGAGDCAADDEKNPDGRSDGGKDKPQVEATTLGDYNYTTTAKAGSEFEGKSATEEEPPNTTMSTDYSTNAQLTTPRQPVNYRLGRKK